MGGGWEKSEVGGMCSCGRGGQCVGVCVKTAWCRVENINRLKSSSTFSISFFFFFYNKLKSSTFFIYFFNSKTALISSVL